MKNNIQLVALSLLSIVIILSLAFNNSTGIIFGVIGVAALIITNYLDRRSDRLAEKAGNLNFADFINRTCVAYARFCRAIGKKFEPEETKNFKHVFSENCIKAYRIRQTWENLTSVDEDLKAKEEEYEGSFFRQIDELIEVAEDTTYDKYIERRLLEIAKTNDDFERYLSSLSP